ncbi:Hydroxylamine reductase [BD1-7 clade bacterium]|uniref:Hydroxylamine reductase n=1 Tax=BD1-7 clade bacterium TaxID=2029982 RepID=A0A5S9QZD7_9GAMM|nr:Hydroxylamine reductase [BD1-7 clade bacterium]
MFCIQCEQTLTNDRVTGCQFKQGKCGKEADTADLQDLLIYMLEGIGQFGFAARQFGAIDPEIDQFIPEAFFTTLTNVNFDEDRFVALIATATRLRNNAKAMYLAACEKAGEAPQTFEGPANFTPAQTKEGLLEQAAVASIKEDEAGPDVFGLRCLVLYGLKGCAAYGEHALMLGEDNQEVFGKFHEYLSLMASKPTDIDVLLEAALGVGGLNYEIMGLLDKGSTTNFGHPEPTQVKTTPIKGKAILVSGHDMVDLEAILKQTEGTGINVYTHGELLPAHAYPKLKAYSHLAGNYGTAWQNQQEEFSAFPGAIVMTSNCLINPYTKGYDDRIWTCGPVGWPGVPHIEARDFSSVIDKAQQLDGFPADLIEKTITIGFAHNAVMGVADKVVDGVKSGAIKHFFLIGGCDGAAPGRNYYTEFAENTPDDTVMLTIGCGKYRFNDKEFGDIGGIPRLLDVGQCNDSYSAIQIALALCEAFECEVNDLPLTLIVSWFEQKAAAVLLTLLHLGIKNIHLGPSLPPFLTPNLVNFLVENFDLKPIGDAKQDIANILNAA